MFTTLATRLQLSLPTVGGLPCREETFVPLPLFLLALLGTVLANYTTIEAQTPLPANQKASKLAPKHAPAATPAALVLEEKDRQIIEQLLAAVRTQPSGAARLKLISSQLLGQPYLTHPLIGSPVEPEQLVARLDGFDCVTYVETVLALSRATDVSDFLQRLRDLRYAKGEVSYFTRLHFSTDWKRENVQRGVFRDITRGELTVERTKTLGGAVGLPNRVEPIRFFPKANFAALSALLQDGDVILFVSGRNWLDTNHMGLVFREGDRLLMRHASRSHRQVTEQALADFVRTNKMIGFIVARPSEARR